MSAKDANSAIPLCGLLATRRVEENRRKQNANGVAYGEQLQPQLKEFVLGGMQHGLKECTGRKFVQDTAVRDLVPDGTTRQATSENTVKTLLPNLRQGTGGMVPPPAPWV